jgi:hypothetical protein
MQVIHTSVKKSKKRKPTAKQRELQAEWEKMMKKYEPKRPIKPVPVRSPVVTSTYVRTTEYIPSLDTGLGTAALKESPRYTGTMIKGIGTMHKSNAVPIFSDEQAVEIATMRRG